MRAFCVLLLLGLATPSASAQTTVPDSLEMKRQVYHDVGISPPHRGSYLYQCTTQIIGTWPDVLKTDNALSYRRVTPGGSGNIVASRSDGHAVPAKHVGIVGFTLPGRFVFERAREGEEPDLTRCNQRQVQALVMLGSLPPWYAVYDAPNGQPVALYTWRQAQNRAVVFDASFESDQSHEVDTDLPSGKRPVVSYAWDFGDGQSGTGDRPTHTYARADTFSVTLTVTDDDGQTDARTQEVVVAAALLSYRIESEDTPVSGGREFTLSAQVTNIGTEDAESVRIDQSFVLASVFADSLSVYTRRAPEISVVPIPGATVIERDRLAPGESVEVRARYRVDATGAYVPAGQTEFVPVESDIHATLFKARAVTSRGEPVNVVNACENGGCNDVTVIRPPGLDVDLEFRTDGRTVTEAKAGLEFDPDIEPLLYQVLGIPFVTPFSFDGSVDPNTGIVSDLVRHCHTSCADVHFTLKDSGSGEPIEGATVTLTATAIPGSANVTPDHSGGHFCTPGTLSQTCGATVDAETDENGEIQAYYSFPRHHHSSRGRDHRHGPSRRA